ncbi:MAG: hypothetical protein WA021_05055 [Minisyncoccia bacterium]
MQEEEELTDEALDRALLKVQARHPEWERNYKIFRMYHNVGYPLFLLEEQITTRFKIPRHTLDGALAFVIACLQNPFVWEDRK